jgi:hypothetical protein
VTWIPPVSKNVVKLGVKYGVKYGPQAKIAWDVAGKQVQSAAKTHADNVASRRKAFAEAETVVDGSVLRLAREGRPVWVVYSGEQPHSSYPLVPVELSVLVSRADLSKRQTPLQHREAQLRARAKRASKKAGQISVKTAQAGKKAARRPRRLKNRSVNASNSSDKGPGQD